MPSHVHPVSAQLPRDHADERSSGLVDLTAPGLTIEHLVARDIEAFSARRR